MNSLNDEPDTECLLARIQQGDCDALSELLELHRSYARRIVEARMDQGLRRRVDPSDIIQEVQMDVAIRIQNYLQRRPSSFRIWLRSELLEKLIDFRRRHQALKRDFNRECNFSDASSIMIASRVISGHPSQIARNRELTHQIRSAIAALGETDREMLLLRHVEELSNAEAAGVLDLSPDSARKRYGRALRRLAVQLTTMGITGV